MPKASEEPTAMPYERPHNRPENRLKSGTRVEITFHREYGRAATHREYVGRTGTVIAHEPSPDIWGDGRVTLRLDKSPADAEPVIVTRGEVIVIKVKSEKQIEREAQEHHQWWMERTRAEVHQLNQIIDYVEEQLVTGIADDEIVHRTLDFYRVEQDRDFRYHTIMEDIVAAVAIVTVGRYRRTNAPALPKPKGRRVRIDE
jgi:hypothetical protein